MRYGCALLLTACGGLAVVDTTTPPASGTMEMLCPEDASSGTVAVPYGSIVQLWRCKYGQCDADYTAMSEGWEVVIPCRDPGELYILTWIRADGLSAKASP